MLNSKWFVLFLGICLIVFGSIVIGCGDVTQSTPATTSTTSTTTTTTTTTTSTTTSTTTTTTSTTTTSLSLLYSVAGVVRFTGAGSFEVSGVNVGVPFNSSKSTTTDASGVFTISDLTGSQFLVFTKEGYTFTPTMEVVTDSATLEIFGIPTGWRSIDTGFESMLKVVGYDDDASPYHYFVGGVGGTLLQLTYDAGSKTFSDSVTAWFSPSNKPIIGVAPTDRDTGLVWLYDTSGGVYSYEAGVNYATMPSDPSDWDLSFQMGVADILDLSFADSTAYVLTGESSGNLYISSDYVTFTPVSSPSGSGNLTYILADEDEGEYSVVLGDSDGIVWIYTGSGYTPTSWTSYEVSPGETINMVNIDGDIGYAIALCQSGAVYRSGDSMDLSTWSIMFETPYALSAMDALGEYPGLSSSMIVGENGLILVYDAVSQ